MSKPIDPYSIELQNYAGLIFDCDGTLTNSMPLHYIAWRDTLAQIGIQFSEQRFYALGGMPTEKIIELLASEQGVAADPIKTGIDKENAFLKNIESLQPINAVCDIAKQCSGSIPISVASGGNRQGVVKQLEAIGMLALFPVIVTAEDTVNHKPAPDVFLHAAELMHIPPQNCLVLEDSPLGFQAAEAAEMDYVDVRPLAGDSCSQ